MVRIIRLRRVSCPVASSRRTVTTLPLLVSPSEVQELLDASRERRPVLLDATWFMPDAKRDANAEFIKTRLPGALRWDLDEIAMPNEGGLKHMLPAFPMFAEACSARGITAQTPVILYDTHGLFSSPRALFTFKTFGHESAAVLDGGMPRWLSEQRNTETGQTSPPNPVKSYEGQGRSSRDIASYQDVQQSSADGKDAILDARSSGRFHGTDPEPRAGLSSGHMPNSLSLPYISLLTPSSQTQPPYQTLLPATQLRQVVADALGSEDQLQRILSGQRRTITTCGSGMTAAVIWLALKVLGAKDVSLYDESWTGYASRPNSVIEKT